MANITGSAGNDIIVGGDSSDTIIGGAGDDTIIGGAGDDTIIGGVGNDTITGDIEGLSTPAGSQTFSVQTAVFSYATGTNIGDGLLGGTQHIASVNSDDLSDLTITTFDGNANITSGETIIVSFTNEVGDSVIIDDAIVQQTAFGNGTPGTGIITAQGTDANDDPIAVLVKFNQNDGSSATPISVGDPYFDTDVEPDSIPGVDSGSDAVLNLVDIASFDDTIIGGAGDDTINGGVGNDTITGGTGNDKFIYTQGEDLTITDFGTGSTNVDDGDSSNNDFVDLSDYYTNQNEFEADLNDDGILNQSAGDYSDNTSILGGQITGLASLNGIDASSLKEQTGVACFCSGTLINTVSGPRCIENIQIGEVIKTQTGVSEVKWIGRRVIGLTELRANPKLFPIRIRSGALGKGLPKRDLAVSRQHRMLVKSKIAARMFGEEEVLISAIKLTELPDIFVDDTVEKLEYFHMLFDQHEVIYAEGAPTESLFTGPEAIKTLSPEAREEILTIFPQVADLHYAPEAKHFIPPLSRQKRLVERHVKNKVSCL